MVFGYFAYCLMSFSSTIRSNRCTISLVKIAFVNCVACDINQRIKSRRDMWVRVKIRRGGEIDAISYKCHEYRTILVIATFLNAYNQLEEHQRSNQIKIMRQARYPQLL